VRRHYFAEEISCLWKRALRCRSAMMVQQSSKGIPSHNRSWVKHVESMTWVPNFATIFQTSVSATLDVIFEKEQMISSGTADNSTFANSTVFEFKMTVIVEVDRTKTFGKIIELAICQENHCKLGDKLRSLTSYFHAHLRLI
jgi:hypothetical protein